MRAIVIGGRAFVFCAEQNVKERDAENCLALEEIANHLTTLELLNNTIEGLQVFTCVAFVSY